MNKTEEVIIAVQPLVCLKCDGAFTVKLPIGVCTPSPQVTVPGNGGSNAPPCNTVCVSVEATPSVPSQSCPQNSNADSNSNSSSRTLRRKLPQSPSPSNVKRKRCLANEREEEIHRRLDATKLNVENNNQASLLSSFVPPLHPTGRTAANPISEDENVDEPVHAPFTAGLGKSMAVTKEQPDMAKSMLKNFNDTTLLSYVSPCSPQPKPGANKHSLGLFTTGNGKSISVPKEQLEAAKARLQSIDVDQSCLSSSRPSSTRPSFVSPLRSAAKPACDAAVRHEGEPTKCLFTPERIPLSKQLKAGKATPERFDETNRASLASSDQPSFVSPLLLPATRIPEPRKEYENVDEQVLNDTCLFTTGRGKGISLSKKQLAAAQATLESFNALDQSCLPSSDRPPFVSPLRPPPPGNLTTKAVMDDKSVGIFTTGGGESIALPKQQLDATKEHLDNVDFSLHLSSIRECFVSPLQTSPRVPQSRYTQTGKNMLVKKRLNDSKAKPEIFSDDQTLLSSPGEEDLLSTSSATEPKSDHRSASVQNTLLFAMGCDSRVTLPKEQAKGCGEETSTCLEAQHVSLKRLRAAELETEDVDLLLYVGDEPKTIGKRVQIASKRLQVPVGRRTLLPTPVRTRPPPLRRRIRIKSTPASGGRSMATKFCPPKQSPVIERTKKVSLEPRTCIAEVSSFNQVLKPTLREVLAQEPGLCMTFRPSLEELERIGVRPHALAMTYRLAKEYKYDGSFCARAAFKEMLTVPIVSDTLLKEDWVQLQFGLITWKLACLERCLPNYARGRLSRVNLMNELHARYDHELVEGHRPALRKVLEGDIPASRFMVLMVTEIVSFGDDSDFEGESGGAIVEVSDGWYCCKAGLDEGLTEQVSLGRIEVGQKLRVANATLQLAQPTTPLELPSDTIALKFCINSTRRSVWDATLGFPRKACVFAVNSRSIRPAGGLVPCVDIVLIRVYPTLFLETKADGKSVRSRIEEESEQARFEVYREHRLEEIKLSIWSNEHPLRGISRQLAGKVQTEEEVGLASLLTESEKRAYKNALRRQMQERESMLARQVESDSSLHRDVAPFVRLLVRDSPVTPSAKEDTFSITIWRPSEELLGELQEGRRFRVSSLAAPKAQSYSPDRELYGRITLSATNRTIWQGLKPRSAASFIPRQLATVANLKDKRIGTIFDACGVVVHRTTLEHNVVFVVDETNSLLGVSLKRFSLRMFPVRVWRVRKNIVGGLSRGLCCFSYSIPLY